MISTEEKLSMFSMKVLDNANQKRNAMLEEFKKGQEEMLQAKELEFLEEAYQRIQESISSIHKEQNEKEASIENEYRIQLLKTRQAIFDDVFQKVNEKLQNFMKSESYKTWLLDSVRRALDEVGESENIIYVNKSDEALVSLLESEFAPAKVEISSDDMIGGCKVYNKLHGMISDHSMANEIEHQKVAFVRNSGLNINLL